MIEINGLTKRFGRALAVDGATLRVGAGESVALWGANGAGKSTIIRCVLGLHRYRGTIRVGGLDVQRSGKAARRLIGYVPQELSFYDDLRVGEAIRFFSTLRAQAGIDTAGILARVGLAGHERKRVRELSGGMKQRLALAIALLGDPPILVLDEVTASLDAAGRAEFVALLSRLAKTSGRAMLFASHRPDEIESLASRVITLDRGRVVADSDVSAFARQHHAGERLHLLLDPTLCAQGIELLRGRGFTACPNGRGIFVTVAAGQRMAPLHVLADARITVDDIDILPESSSHPSRGTEA